MLYTEAFKALGYSLRDIRNDWTASKPDGVCITIWEREIEPNAGRHLNTKLDCGPHERWKDKRGNKRRIEHISRAMAEFDGFVDVILVSGIPDKGYGDATPWKPLREGEHWRITFFEPETGHFFASVVQANPA
jgi:hypothetical protein